MVYTLFVKLECSTVILDGLDNFSYAEEIKIFVIFSLLSKGPKNNCFQWTNLA